VRRSSPDHRLETLMLQLDYKPFDFDYYDKNFRDTEAVE
jgi:hypothetical protein